MNRRNFLMSSAAGSVAWAQGGRRQPNVVLVMFDKCRADAIGAYGDKQPRTPNIDKLASEGVVFRHAYSPQALCGPARASLFTGRAPHAHGLRRNVYPAEAGRLNSNYPEPVPDPFRDPRFRLWDNTAFLLNNAGYATAHIGKWHLGPGNPGFFDYFKSFNSLLRHWVGEPHQSPYRPDVHTDQAIRFAEQHAKEPFLLCLSFYAPHEPLDPPKRFLTGREREPHADYHATVTSLDENVGRLADSLRKLGVFDNTLFVLTADHGRTWDKRPGSGEGIAVSYEEVSRIPMIARFPGVLPAGRQWDSGVTLTDLAPTMLEATGVTAGMGTYESRLSWGFHGQSLISEVRSGRDDWSRPVIMENTPQLGIDGSYFDERAVRTKRYKLIVRKFDARPELRPGELYDMQADPDEHKNLWDAEPARVRELGAVLADWSRRTRDETGAQLAEWIAGR
jgi:arylsulfatase A-like enzyme